jgi:Phage tail tube protein
MPITYGSGAQIYFGYEVETTPGTLVTDTLHYLPVDPDGTTFDYDAGRQALKLGMGTIFNDFVAVELQAKGTGSVSFPLWGNLGHELLAACGFTGGGPITLPGYISAIVQRVAAVLAYPGCRASSVDFTFSANKPVTVDIKFDFIGTPTALDNALAPITTTPWYADRTSYVAPTFTQEKPFVWSDVGKTSLVTMAGITMISGAVDPVAVSDIKLTCNFNQQPFYGAHGSNLPSALITSDVEVTGTFTRLFENVEEYNLYNAHCMIPGEMIIPMTSSCPLGGGHTVPSSATFTMANCVYTKQGFKNPIKGPITEDYSFLALAASGASPLSFVLVAEH